MNILFDLSATQQDNEIINHGGSEYAKAVFMKLTESSPESISVSFNQHLSLERALSETIKKHSLVTLENRDMASVCRFIRDNNINIFYTALPKNIHTDLIRMQSDSFKVILTIHGLRPLELPTESYEWQYCLTLKSKIKFIYKQLFPNGYRNSVLKYYRRLIRAYGIITVSNNSKSSLLNFFPELKADKIHVFYSPLINYTKESVSGHDPISNLSLSPRHYFLLLSGSIWTKNSFRAIKAFDNLVSINRAFDDYKMLVTGIRNQFIKVKNQKNFVFTDYLNRKTLEDLFKNSLALIYPTLNEGFGYPPLEAMKYGVPVLASEIGSIKEVCGDAAYYFNPQNITEIENSLFSAIEKKDLFSDENLQIRYNRYELIKRRQEDDLNKMVTLLLGSDLTFGKISGSGRNA